MDGHATSLTGIAPLRETTYRGAGKLAKYRRYAPRYLCTNGRPPWSRDRHSMAGRPAADQHGADHVGLRFLGFAAAAAILRLRAVGRGGRGDRYRRSPRISGGVPL